MKETLRKFENIQDPFNPSNFLTGYITIDQGDHYGQLLLTEINGAKCEEQIIYSTPKMHYPFDKLGRFYFETLNKEAQVYEKLDGTNIISYKYEFKNRVYLTYKTRLNPVLGQTRFGDFYSMWREMLKRYPVIEQTARVLAINFSYELYGILNKHLILYPMRLDTQLLFGLNKDNGKIILPDIFRGTLPVISKDFNIYPHGSFSKVYKELQVAIETTNDYTNLEEVKGSEGRVIYIKEEDQWKQWKLKPGTIFALHCQGGMNKNDIMTTCYNALENVELDNLTYEIVAELLKEEFIEAVIIKNEERIKDTIAWVQQEVKRRYLVIEIYEKLGLKLSENKQEVMRKMSESFDRKQMRYVYNIIQAYEN